ncbi:hypothetical protein I4U23_001868 [Adineta vaga]|nr:hypothetical protein I4U23_001868 [Adineta vaga]
MGNIQQHHRHQIELQHPDAIYLPNDIVCGTITNVIKDDLLIILIGTVRFKKHKKKQIEYREIIFFSSTFPLNASSSSTQTFQLPLNEHLPPSFNQSNIFPQISYSLNLIYQTSKDRIYSSLPLRICPRLQIDQPSLLTPFIFGPIDNHNYGTKLQIKVNRSAFKFGDTIVIFYELQNPLEKLIQTVDVSLGIYYLVESNIHQEDVKNTIDNVNVIDSKPKLIRHKVLLRIPEEIYLPPTFKFKYDQDGERSQFNLTIEYKIQLKIYLRNPENLWQVDVPIVLCNELIEQTKRETEEVSSDCETDVVMNK